MLQRYNHLIKKPTGSSGGETVLERKIEEVMGSLRHLNPEVLGSSTTGLTDYGMFMSTCVVCLCVMWG